ncbi:MAG: glycoside hydrolase, partial [Acidobacteria bacterium]
SNVIWTGSDTGMIHLTRDGGKTWNDVTPPGLSDWSKISLIDAGHFDAGTAYAAVDRHRLDDTAPHIYGTHDFGKNWKQMIACLLPNECSPDRVGRNVGGSVNMLSRGTVANAYVRAVREDPVRKGLLFAGTERGVYFSGNIWNSLQLNLPATPIQDLVIKNNDLIVATHGRSFWVLDDLSPLRLLSNVGGREPEHLFKPAGAVRLRKSVNNDTPLPPEEPQGDNPPAGATIYYWISPNSTGEILLDVIDQSGELVRRYSSNDKPRTLRTPPAFPNYWLPKPEILSAEPGMHRFVWDLRYAPPAVGGGYAMAVANKQTESQPQGPLVVPGSYRVRLTVGGQSYEQTLEVGPDPRVKASAQDYAQQFALAKRVYDALQQAGETIHEIDRRRAELKQQPNPELDRKLLALAGAARGEEEEDAAAAPTSITLRRVSASLAHLLGVVESADAPPTRQAGDAADEALQQLNELLAKARELVALK